jgi:hypothetical protein
MQSHDEKLFISYSRADRVFTQVLVADLRRTGIAVWLDETDIPPGAKWDQAIEAALEGCSSVLFVLSPSSIESTNVLDEIAFALDEGKRIIPIKHKECKTPLRLRRVQQIDFTTDYSSALKRLVDHCKPAATLSVATSSNTVRAPKKPHGRVFMYHIRVAGTREDNQPLLDELLKFSFVERQSRFINEADNTASRVALFSERDFELHEVQEIAARCNSTVIEVIEV